MWALQPLLTLAYVNVRQYIFMNKLPHQGSFFILDK